jgi:hypothetical protein
MTVKYLDAKRIQGVTGTLASTGWDIASGFTLTSGVGIIADLTAEVNVKPLAISQPVEASVPVTP